jgi:mono/diheme cytochrome c family protein
MPVLAQDDATGASSSAPISRQPPIRHTTGAKLTEQEQRGGALFIQRCALCHLSKSFGTAGSKYCCVRSLGPSLNGMFRNMEPEQEQAMREIILNGGPTLMPGWKYGLEPKDIDDIIAYLKTLN